MKTASKNDFPKDQIPSARSPKMWYQRYPIFGTSSMPLRVSLFALLNWLSIKKSEPSNLTGCLPNIVLGFDLSINPRREDV